MHNIPINMYIASYLFWKYYPFITCCSSLYKGVTPNPFHAYHVFFFFNGVDPKHPSFKREIINLSLGSEKKGEEERKKERGTTKY